MNFQLLVLNNKTKISHIRLIMNLSSSNYGTRHKCSKINEAILNALIPGENSNVPQSIPIISITLCNNHKLGPIIGKEGAICPYCNDVLKNKATLDVHMKKCLNNNMLINAISSDNKNYIVKCK